MKVAMLPGSVSRSAGGLFTSVRRLSESLDTFDNVSVTVVGNRDEHSEQDSDAWKQCPVILNKSAMLGRASELRNWLGANEPDLVHSQFLWSYASLATSGWYASDQSRRYLVSPRGMLDPWALNHSRWKKRIAAALFERKHLCSAACIHALCASEAEAIRAYGLTNPVAVIPNGIDLPSEDEISQMQGQANDASFVSKDRQKTMLFVGRIHEKKGLLPLVRAWSQSSRLMIDWRLVIAGWDDGGHLGKLKQQVVDLGLTQTVQFVGSLYGDAKAKALATADAFILPSFSEGLPMAVLEAWAYRLPVLMTEHCNLPEGFAAEAAIRIGTDDASIATGMDCLITAGDSQRKLWGENGRRLVETHFTWPGIAGQMLEVYRWVGDGGPRPDCVLAD